MAENFEAVRRAVGCQSAVLESGLTVLVRPMPGYSSTYAIYGTRFGSIDLDFEVDGKTVHLPAGTAHFLDHNMFESEEGDAFARFAKTGASANACKFTCRSCIHWSSSSKVSTKSTALPRCVASSFLAMHGPMNTTEAPGYRSFSKAPCACIGVLTWAR